MFEDISKLLLLVLHSLGNKNERKVKIIQDYISENMQAKTNFILNKSSVNLPIVYPKKPDQANNKDCGIYLIKYIEEIFKM